jgi:hypothetical protein
MIPRFLSSCRWALPLLLLLPALLVMLGQRPAADHRLTDEPAAFAESQEEAVALAAFDEWPAAGRATGTMARGVALARARRVVLKELIRADPQAFLWRWHPPI